MNNRREQAIDLFLQLIAINSPSGDEHRVREFVRNYLHNLNIKTVVDSYGNIVAYPSSDYSQGAILFATHLDTVPNAINVKAIRDEKRIYTDGTTALGADDKSAIASTLVAIEYIIKNNIVTHPIVLLFSVEEETGLDGAKHLDTTLLPQIKEAYIPDAQLAIGHVVIHSPAKLDAHIIFKGKAAHAGFNPETGISAISLAARAIDHLKLLRIDEETTANIGSIIGGEANNIVPSQCEIHLEVRSNSKERCHAHLAHLEMCCIKAVGAIGGSYTLSSELKYPSYSIEEQDPALLQFKKACATLKLPYKATKSGGGSDTNILRGYGIDAITLASGYTKAHSTEESIPLESFETLIELIITLAKK
jgi:tripeptide aminopeptidase